MNLQRSIFNLIRTNGGFFKSEKQSAFIRNMADRAFGGSWQWVSETAWGHQALYIAKFDENGVTSVSKMSLTTKKEETYFERKLTLEEWHAKHDAQGRLRDEFTHIRDLTGHYKNMLDARDYRPEFIKTIHIQYWPRFMRNAYNAANRMQAPIMTKLMKDDLTKEDAFELMEEFKAINDRRDAICERMAERAKGYDKIHDDLWEVLREYDCGRITVALIDEIDL